MKILFYIIIFVSALIMVSCNDDDKDCIRCNLIPDTGPCRAFISRYFYNQQTAQCEEFIWGGCEGVVPFETMHACLDCCEN